MERAQFLESLEAKYKSAFPPVGEETLAGGMSNTIAGRICNYFDLKGGCYTVDGACASSLLSIAHACAALQAGELDLARGGRTASGVAAIVSPRRFRYPHRRLLRSPRHRYRGGRCDGADRAFPRKGRGRVAGCFEHNQSEYRTYQGGRRRGGTDQGG